MVMTVMMLDRRPARPRFTVLHMPALAIANPWTPYGLGDDPFFQDPLAPTDDPARPISLFVGRGAEVQLLGGQVVGSLSSRAVVQGSAGVGKTSFVNRLKAALADHGVLTHEEPVRVRPGMTPRQFCAEVLRVLLQIRATLEQERAGGRAGYTRAALAAETSGDTEAVFWRRVGRVVEGEDSVAGGLTLGPVGAQRERVRIPSEVPELSLFDELAQALAYLAGDQRHPEGRRGTAERRRVLVHVNNLENLSREEAGAAAGLMQDVRDAFLFPHGHWLFVGAGDIEHAVFAAPQVRGIIPVAVTLEPLGAGEVAELLDRRYRHVQRGVRLTPPVAPTDAAELYTRYRGDLRNYLRLLSRAVQHYAVGAPGRPLDAAAVVRLMAPVYRAELVRRLGPADAAHLESATRGQMPDAEFRVTDLAARTGLTQAAASKIVQRLLAAGALAPGRVAGKSVYYRLAGGDFTVALGL